MNRSLCITNIKKAVEPVGENILVAVILLSSGIMAGLAKPAVPTLKHVIGKAGCDVIYPYIKE